MKSRSGVLQCYYKNDCNIPYHRNLIAVLMNQNLLMELIVTLFFWC